MSPQINRLGCYLKPDPEWAASHLGYQLNDFSLSFLDDFWNLWGLSSVVQRRARAGG